MLSTKINYLLKIVFTLLLLTQSTYSYALFCGQYITRDVTLQSDLHCSYGSEAASIGAHNITINLNGFTLSGDSSLRGIYVREYDNLKVINGSISGFWGGVTAFRSDNLTVENVTFYKLGHAVVSQGGSYASINNNKFIDTTSYAISLSANIDGHTSNDNNIYNNQFYRTYSGINICGGPAQRNNIVNNLIWKSTGHGIHLDNASFNKIINNQIMETGDAAGIRLNDSSYNQIADNTLTEGTLVGLSVLTDASTSCLDSTFDNGSRTSVKNQIIGNHISEFPTLVNLGLGISSSPTLIGNKISNNNFSNANIGVSLRVGTKYNYGRDNRYDNVNQNIRDAGIRNFVE